MVPRKKRVVKDKETREREIQLAARKVFFKKGFLASTIEEIAREANVARGTIYLYYENKDDLYLSLIVYMTSEIGDGLSLIEGELDRGNLAGGRDIVMRILDVYFGIYSRDPDGFAIYAILQSGFFSNMDLGNLKKLNETARRNSAITRRIVSKGKAQGLFKPEVSEPVMADAFWSTFLGHIIVTDTKKRVTGKDFIRPTVTATFGHLAQAIALDSPGRVGNGKTSE